MIRAFLVVIIDKLLGAWRAWQRDRAHDTAIVTEAQVRNDLEDMLHDQTEADRITRAVDALRHDGAGRLPAGRPAAGGKPDTRGYRD